MKNLADLVPCLTLLIYAAVATAGAFVGGVWGVAGIGGAILFFLTVWKIDQRIPRPQVDYTAIAITALGVMALSNLHSTQPGISWFEWRKLGTVFLPLILWSCPSVQARADHPKLFIVLPLAALAGAIALGLELDSNGIILKSLKGPAASLQGYNRGFSYLIVLAMPIMAGVGVGGWGLGVGKKDNPNPEPQTLNPWWFIALFALILLIPASLSESRAAKLALMLALPVVVCAHLWPIAMRRILMTLPVVCLGWPFAAQEFFRTHYDWLKYFPDSWRARMEIWDYMSYRIMERPLLGWGLGTAHSMDFNNPHGAQYVFTTVAASHPHDAVVQLWVEMGLPGLALGLLFAFWTLQKAGRLDPRLAPFALGAWAAAFCLCLVAYNFWTDSMFAAFALTGLAFALLQRRLKQS